VSSYLLDTTLERYTGNQPISATLIRQWNEASEQWAARLCGLGRVNEVREDLARADRILEAIGASEYAMASRWSPLGFQQHLAEFAAALNGDDAGQLRQAFSAINSHEAARRLEELRGRRDRAEMATRLCRWLDRTADPAANLDAAVDQYLQDASWVDWARHQLLAGDEPEAVSRSYRRLFDRVKTRREQENRVFAGLLAMATAANQSGSSSIPIECVLDRVVAPLARKVPAGVLAVVMDGMSWAVLRELSPDLARHGWLEWVSTDGSGHGCALTVLPSITSFSRASLLCGALVSGGQAVEKRGFEEHSGLRAAGRSSFPPVLFHKDEIGASGGDLAEATGNGGGLRCCQDNGVVNLVRRRYGSIPTCHSAIHSPVLSCWKQIPQPPNAPAAPAIQSAPHASNRRCVAVTFLVTFRQ
jgi:hypothetical protein